MIAFERGLSILEVIVEGDRVRAPLIADRVGLPVSTVYRYLRVLRARGLVRESDGWYVPTGTHSRRVASRFDDELIVETATPILRSLVATSEDTAVIVVRSGLFAVCLQRVSASRRDSITQMPDVMPLLAGACTRVLLASAPPAVARQVMRDCPASTAPGAPTPDSLQRDLDNVRRRGVAVTRNECIDGATSVAVPVFMLGETACSIEVTGIGRRDASWEGDMWMGLRATAASVREALHNAIS